MPVRNGNPGNYRTTTTTVATVCENNWVRKIARVTRADVQKKNGGVKETYRSAEELDRETGEEQTTVGRTRVRMANDRLPKRAAELREQGRRRRGRPMLRWENCVKRDARKVGEEEDCKKKTRDRGWWKRLSDEAVKKLWAAPNP